MENVNALQQIFNEHELYLFVIQYSIFHEVIEFALHKGNFNKHIKVMCGGAKYFSGHLKGGPYTLTIVPEKENLIIKDDDSKLRLIVESINEITSIRGGF